jgi:dTMP kinase
MARLIVFEGIDGSGKTTLSRMLDERLKGSGIETLWLREPTDSPLGDRIRKIAQTKRTIPPREELDYFIKDRKWDVKRNIEPALRAGKTVILDRYFYSNACYQGARGLDMEEILEANRRFAPEADIVFVIDVDVKTALERIRRNRLSQARLFEKESFLQKVRENYLKLSGPNIVLIDGNGDVTTVFARIVRFL